MKNKLIVLFFLFSLFLFSNDLYLPKADPDNQIVHHANYSLSYNEEYEQAEWVAYELTREEVLGNIERKDSFRADLFVSTDSASLSDYKGSGYDRGHLAPAADMKFSETAMSESFYLSNMSPQVPSFNRGIWKKLEDLVRQWAIDNESIYVVTAGVLNENIIETIGDNQVAVPFYYYKVILDYAEPELKGIAFILPNEKSDLPVQSFATSIDNVEKVTGIDFFYQLEDSIEESLESSYSLAQWAFNQDYQSQSTSKITNNNDISDTGKYWINSSSTTRHNSSCRYYGNTKNGYYTNEEEGTPCGSCGG